MSQPRFFSTPVADARRGGASFSSPCRSRCGPMASLAFQSDAGQPAGAQKVLQLPVVIARDPANSDPGKPRGQGFQLGPRAPARAWRGARCPPAGPVAPARIPARARRGGRCYRPARKAAASARHGGAPRRSRGANPPPPGCGPRASRGCAGHPGKGRPGAGGCGAGWVRRFRCGKFSGRGR